MEMDGACDISARETHKYWTGLSYWRRIRPGTASRARPTTASPLHRDTDHTNSARVPAPSIQHLTHRVQRVQHHVCSVYAHACAHACHLPMRPYDPSEQGGPLHTEAPAERERIHVVSTT